MIQTELAWAAGFFDGEGCISTRQDMRRGTTYRRRSIHLQVTQKGREPLDRFRAAIGCGRVLGPYTNGKTDVRDVFRWQANTKEEVHHGIWMLWHWLSGPKHRQIDRVLKQYHAGSWDDRRGPRVRTWDE